MLYYDDFFHAWEGWIRFFLFRERQMGGASDVVW